MSGARTTLRARRALALGLGAGALAVLAWLALRDAAPVALVSTPLDSAEHSAAASSAVAAPPAEPVSERAREAAAVPALAAEEAAAAAPEAVPVEERPPATLEVEVTDAATGAPVPGCHVEVRPTDSADAERRLGRARTDERGLAAIDVPAGVRLHVDVQAPAPDGPRGRTEPALAPGEVRRVELALEVPERRPWHALLLDPTERAVAGALVRTGGFRRPFIADPEGAEWLDDARARSDPGGRVALSIPAGTTVRVEAEGFAPVALAAVPGFERPDDPLVIRLRPAATIVGRAADAAGNPLAGRAVRVTAWSDDLAPDPSLRASPFQWTTHATTDGNGDCRLTALPAESALQVEVADGTGSLVVVERQLVLAGGQTAELDWTLGPGAGATIEGEAWETDGSPAADVEIWLGRGGHRMVDAYASPVARTRTDERGRFRFEEVARGRWHLAAAPERAGARVAAPDPQAIAPVAEPVEIAHGAELVRVTLVLHRGLYVQGRVLDTDGEPLESGSVHARAPGFLMRGSVVAGRFAVGPLAPGAYELVARGGTARSPAVTARAGQAGVELRLAPLAHLVGRVVDASGAPMHAEVSARPVDGEERIAMHVRRTDAEGRFAFKGLEPGAWDLVAQSQAGGVVVERGVLATPGEEAAVELVLAPGARLALRYEGAHARVLVTTWAAGDTLVDGRVLGPGADEVDVVTVPGALRLEVAPWPRESRVPDFAAQWRQELELAASERRAVTLTEP